VSPQQCRYYRQHSLIIMSLLNIDGNPMRFNNLGDSGLMVSEISFGTVSSRPCAHRLTRLSSLVLVCLLTLGVVMRQMTFSDVDKAATGTGEGAKADDAYQILETCYKGGVNFFDCAEGYGYAGAAERVLGEAIQIGLKKGTWDRMVSDPPLPDERSSGPGCEATPCRKLNNSRACRIW
jgi:hypothetical protein